MQSRYYAPALGRFLNADSYASTGQGFLGYNMFAYCNNTAPNTADYNGNDAIWIQEANSARGFGHSGLMVQDENGDWYYFYWGPQDESYTFGMLIIGVDRRIVVEKVDAKDYNLRELGGVRRAISDSDNTFVKNRADKITAAFYFSGDYTETMNTLQGWVNENDHYQLLTDNCVQRSIIAMGKSNNLFDNLAFTIPNNAMYSVYIRSDNAVPNSWHFYSKTHSYRTVS